MKKCMHLQYECSNKMLLRRNKRLFSYLRKSKIAVLSKNFLMPVVWEECNCTCNCTEEHSLGATRINLTSCSRISSQALFQTCWQIANKLLSLYNLVTSCSNTPISSRKPSTCYSLVNVKLLTSWRLRDNKEFRIPTTDYGYRWTNYASFWCVL